VPRADRGAAGATTAGIASSSAGKSGDDSLGRIVLRDNLEAPMEPWIWKRMLWTVGFLCVTYLPVQFVALRQLRGVSRVAAALPLLFMVPMIYVGLQPATYRDGSLYGMYFICPYLPTMIYLLAVSYTDSRRPNVCPHCGHKARVKSFQMTRSATICEKCGQSVLAKTAAERGTAFDDVRI